MATVVAGLAAVSMVSSSGMGDDGGDVFIVMFNNGGESDVALVPPEPFSAELLVNCR